MVCVLVVLANLFNVPGVLFILF